MLDAIASAATNDEQISEETILQALELITRGEQETIWIKASVLREKVARLMWQPMEKQEEI